MAKQLLYWGGCYFRLRIGGGLQTADYSSACNAR